jgi:hypothetical protein
MIVRVGTSTSVCDVATGFGSISVMTAARRFWRTRTAMVALLPTIAGCSGLFEPSQEKIKGWLATVPPHSSGRQMYELLKRKGFSPRYETPELIKGERTYSILFFADWFMVEVDLDDAGNVVFSRVSMDQNYP